jgi:membrane protein
MDWSDSERLHALRRRSAAIDVAVRVMIGFRDHRNARNAAVIAYYGFLSLFPLLVVFVTILGFVLEDRPDLQADIIDSVFAQLPFVGETLTTNPERVRGSVPVLIIGLIAALWSGMKAFVAVQGSFDDVAEVHLRQRTGFVTTRGRALVAIGFVGVTQIVTAAMSSVVGVVDLLWLGKALLAIAAVAISGLILGFSYRWLCSTRRTWREVAPGALFGGVAFTVLQVFTTTIVVRAIDNASPVYGNFASVIAILLWLSLHATAALIGAELNEVRRMR